MFRHDWEEALRAAAGEDYSQGEIEAAIMAARGALDHTRQPAHCRRASPSRASEGVGDSETSIRAVHRGRQTTFRPTSRTTSRPVSRLPHPASRAPSQPASRSIAQPAPTTAATPVMVPSVISQAE